VAGQYRKTHSDAFSAAMIMGAKRRFNSDPVQTKSSFKLPSQAFERKWSIAGATFGV
jgi:hypothetical protein